MKLTASIPVVWQQVPPLVRGFLSRALVIFIIWKLLYHLVLFPARFPDKQLTNITAASTTFLYKHLLNEPFVFYSDEIKKGLPKSVIYIKDKRAIGIADSCNGLELYVLYIGFLFCIPSTLKRQLAFMLVGTSLIFVTNGFRCYGLAWMFLNNYSWANFAHHYLFKMVIYSMIFYAWILYVKKSSWYEN